MRKIPFLTFFYKLFFPPSFSPQPGILSLECKRALCEIMPNKGRELNSEISVHFKFKLLYISTVNEVRNREGIPKSRSLREETIKVEDFSASRDLDSEGMGYCCLSG